MDSSSASDEDDAPQEFSAVEVRQQHIIQLKEFQQNLKKSKVEAKEKRRKRDELFKAQKEKKIQELMKRKLPQDVLDAVSTKLKSQKDGKTALIATSDDILEDKDGVEPDDCLADSGVEDEELDTPADFIPLKGTRNLFVATEEDVKKKKISAGQQVLNFKHSHLYNHSVIPRENSKHRKAIAAKMKIFKRNKSL
ncbi:hypothetical protein Btru_015390 [Bulinus truncatus]|nr:hypothetical protein Btru_015390 [Bulinus truncatus]